MEDLDERLRAGRRRRVAEDRSPASRPGRRPWRGRPVVRPLAGRDAGSGRRAEAEQRAAVVEDDAGAGHRRPLPNAWNRLWISETALPCRSTTARYTVSPVPPEPARAGAPSPSRQRGARVLLGEQAARRHVGELGSPRSGRGRHTQGFTRTPSPRRRGLLWPAAATSAASARFSICSSVTPWVLGGNASTRRLRASPSSGSCQVERWLASSSGVTSPPSLSRKAAMRCARSPR